MTSRISKMKAYLLLVLGLSLFGCDQNRDPTFEQCELEAELTPAAAVVGEAVVAEGRQFTTVLDTVVTVGGASAMVVAVERTDCDTCDSCRADSRSNCTLCGTCEACEEACATCVEALTFEVPEQEPGSAPVQITNGYGASFPIAFEVLADSQP